MVHGGVLRRAAVLQDTPRELYEMAAAGGRSGEVRAEAQRVRWRTRLARHAIRWSARALVTSVSVMPAVTSRAARPSP
jgi:hypothetical protein